MESIWEALGLPDNPNQLPIPKQSQSSFNISEKDLRSLVNEIVLRTAPLSSILNAYNLSKEEYDFLVNDPSFLAIKSQQEKYIATLGPEASFILKARALAEDQLDVFGTLVNDQKIDPQVRLGVMKELVKWGELHKEKEKGGITHGVIVTYNFGSLGPPANIKDIN